MRDTTRLVNQIYHILLKEMGPQGWWPADSKPEIVIGAILVQNTNWQNAARSLDKLRQATNFIPKKILNLSTKQLEKSIFTSGFYQNKSRCIKAVLTWFEENAWDYQAMVTRYGTKLRSELLKLPGIGDETADVLLVYVFDQPEFIADKYARKLFSYLGFKAENYRELKRQVSLPRDFSFSAAQELHGLLDEFGKKWLKDQQQFASSFLAKELKNNII